MYSERWDEDEAAAPSHTAEPVRGKIFKGRGRGFLSDRENEISQSHAISRQGRNRSPEKLTGSEGPTSGSDNEFDNRNGSRRSRDQGFGDTSGYEERPRNWSPRRSKYSDDEAERYEERPRKGSPRRSKYSDDEAERYADSSEDFSNLDQRENSSMRRRDGRNDNGYGGGWNRESSWNKNRDRDDRESSWNKNRDRDRDRDDRESSWNKNRDRDDRESSWNKNRDRDDRESSWNKGRDRDDRESSWNKGRDRDRDDRESSWYKGRDRDRDDRESSWNKNRDRDRDDRESSWNKEGSWNRDRERNRDNSWNRARERNRDSSWNRARDRNRDSSWNRDRDRNRDNSWNRDRDRNRDGESSWSNDRRAKEHQPPPKEHYIPNPDPESVEDLFSQNIESGINFDRYDDIQVTVTGENIPPKIERFEEAPICDIVMENIRRSSYTKPTPVQKYALPIIMNGRDMMACAQTGSGKTAAFLIPTINCMLETGDLPTTDRRAGTPQLLIVTPTRELALQIYVEAKKLTHGSHLITEICYGGTDVRHQLNKVQRGCHILIATCGRLMDFLGRGAVSLCRLRHLIIDEADKMLDRGFYDDIENIIKHSTIPVEDKPQNLLFSATFPDDVQELARMFLRDYIFIAVGIIGAACQDVEQRFYLVYKSDKKGRLINLLEDELARSKTLVFVQHKRVADILAAKLSEVGFPATSMHGDREQRQREEALRDFRGGKANILVATAVAARGLDIRGISYVINYDLPQTVDEYVHRIGRTGRVGNRGLAISFYDPDTDSSLVSGISRILVQAGQSIPSFFK